MLDILPELNIAEDVENKPFVEEVIRDFWISCVSREVSYLARKEVLTGKAKFGIIGDGKEIPQVALAHAVKPGDWRSGYYRDQTLMFSLGLSSVVDFFAQLYADSQNDPFSGGRQMNSHFATPTIDDQDNWLDHLSHMNSSSDISSTGGQMARAVGLSLASKIYRQNSSLAKKGKFSKKGNEVCICTIGDASTSEGVFWESVNAAGVQKIPLAIFIWDDGYGISVPTEYQTTKGNISDVLEGFRVNEKGEGFDIYKVKGWNYPALVRIFEQGLDKVRETHIPAIFHVQEVTQPQGHSTSGSHERYKSKERLQWEQDYDCIRVMKEWMIDSGLSNKEALEEIELRAKSYVKECKDQAWDQYLAEVREMTVDLNAIYDKVLLETPFKDNAEAIRQEFQRINAPLYFEVVQSARKMKGLHFNTNFEAIHRLNEWVAEKESVGVSRYNTHLYSATDKAALNVPVIPPTFTEDSQMVPGYQILNTFFDKKLSEIDNLFAFGEDVGHIGDVNQGFAGLQIKYGKERIFDTGIREWTIMGQAIGMAMRGLRPIAEIQYLDYLIYGLTALTDDLATLRYRSNGTQMAPAIIRTRGHRLEGIWHSGSPLGVIINSLRGMVVCVPRDMVQAAGFYNTLLQSSDPGLVIECLNGYRLRETMPENLGDYTVPLGVPEVLINGDDLTLVTYGSCVREAKKALEILENHDVSVELIDVQTLLPFDLEDRIGESLRKTGRILFVDEDVPGGASAYMMQKVLEKQDGYYLLDSAPRTLTANAHRPPYGSDGDYFSKPNPEDIVETVLEIMFEADPGRF